MTLVRQIMGPSVSARRPNEVFLALFQSMSNDMWRLSERMKAEALKLFFQQCTILLFSVGKDDA